MKKTAALTAALSLFWTAPGSGVYSAFGQVVTNRPRPRDILAFPQVAPLLAGDQTGDGEVLPALVKRGLVRGDKDPRAEYLFRREGGRLVPTETARALARFVELLDSKPNLNREYEAETVAKVGRLLDELAEKRDPKTLEARLKVRGETEAWLRSAALPKDNQRAAGDAVIVALTRMVDASGESLGDKVSVDEEDGVLVARDRRTFELYRREDRQGRILFSKEIEDMQRKYQQMIESGKVRAPDVPPTGRLNYQTLIFPYHEMSERLDKFKKLAKHSRLVALLEITNKANRFRPDQLTDEKSQNALLVELSSMTVPGGHTAHDLLGPSFQRRESYLADAEHYLAQFKAAVESLKDADNISAEQMADIQQKQKEVNRALSLMWLESNAHAFETQERKMRETDFDKIVEHAPVDDSKKALYLDQKDKLVDRAQQLRSLYGRIQQMMDTSDETALRNLAQAKMAKGMAAGAALEEARAQLAKESALTLTLLQESQKESQNLQQAMNAFSTTASLLKMAHDSNSVHESAWGKGFLWTPLSFKRAFDGWATFVHGATGWFDGHVKRIESVSANESLLQSAFEAVGNGNYKLAQATLMSLSSGEEIMQKINIPPGEPASEMAIMQASIEAFQGKVQDIKSYHDWADFGGNIVMTTLMAAGAPLVVKPLTVLESGTGRLAKGLDWLSDYTRLSKLPAIMNPINYVWLPVSAVSKVAGNMAVGLESLNNVQHLPGFLQRGMISRMRTPWLKNATVRMYNMFQREAIAAVTLGSMSGSMEGLRWLFDQEGSHYRNGWEALGTGAKFGAIFSVKPENLPWLFGGGAPADLFGMRTRLGRTWWNFGTGGLAGGAVHTVTGTDYVGKMFVNLGKTGRFGTGLAFTGGMVDQIAKYYAGAQLAAWAAEGLHYGWNSLADGWTGADRDLTPLEKLQKDRKRAVDAEKFGMHVMEHAWRFIPVHSLRMGSAEEYYAAEHGAKEYDVKGRRHLLINKGSGAELEFVTPPEIPAFQRLFLRGVGKRNPNVQKFRISDEMLLKMIRNELKDFAGGDPSKLLRVTRMRDGDRIGETIVGREVRAEAWELFKTQLRKSPEFAAEVMKSPTPEMVLSLAEARAPKALEAYRKGRLTGQRKAIVEEHLKTQSQMVKEEVALAEYQNANRNLFSKLRSNLSGTRRTNLVAAEKLLETYTKTERALNDAGLGWGEAIREVRKPSDGLKEFAKEMRSETREWREGAVRGSEKRHYRELVESWRAKLEKLDKAGKLPEKEVAAARKLLEYFETLQKRFDARKTVNGQEVALIQDAKGTQIKSMRPEQFERVIEYTSFWLGKGRPPQGRMRDFVQLATGGGKTLLVFEALLPMIMADAKLGPNTGFLRLWGKPKVVFTTVNTNLQSQARTDFKAFRKILSDVEIMTAEQFKTKLAEGKMLGKQKPEDFWVIADEFDGIGLQPALTIGRETHVATREHPSFRRLQTIVDELQAIAKSDLTPELKAAGAARLKVDLAQALMEARAADGKGLRVQRLDPKQARKIEALAQKLGIEASSFEGSANAALKPLRSFAKGDGLLYGARLKVRGAAEWLIERVPGQKLRGWLQARHAASVRAAEFRRLQAAAEGVAVRQLREVLDPYAKVKAQVQRDLKAGRIDGRKASELLKKAKSARVEADFYESSAELASDRLLKAAKQDADAIVANGERTAQARRTELEARKAAGLDKKTVEAEEARIEKALGAAHERADLLKSAAQESANRLVSKASLAAVEPMFHKLTAEVGAGADPTKVQRLADRYRSAVEKGVAKENAIYEAFERMVKNDAIRLAESPLLKRIETDRKNALRLRDVGEEIVEALKADNPFQAQILVDEARALLVKDANGQYTKVRVKVGGKDKVPLEAGLKKIELLEQSLHQLSELASGRVKADAKTLEAVGQRFQQGAKGGVSDFDMKAVMERDVTKRTRARAKELFEAFWDDPMMDGVTRTRFMMKALSSWVFGKGWIRQEILNMATAHREGWANIRGDNLVNKEFPIHNGEFVPTMDTPMRRYYEVMRGRDLTLPYEHEVLTTVNDVLGSRAGLLGVSGTNPKPFNDHVTKHGVNVHGEPTAKNPTSLRVFENPSAKQNEIARRYRAGLVDAPRMEALLREALVERVTAEGVKAGRLEAGKLSQGQRAGVESEAAARLGRVRGDLKHIRTADEAAAVLSRHGLHNTQKMVDRLVEGLARPKYGRQGVVDALTLWGQNGARDLMVLGFSNTRDLKATLKMLKKMGVQDAEIAKIFSDTEYIASHYPKARVREQMNLEALGTGKVKVLLIDMRVGGRGLDLPFKGNGKSFKGYRNVEILILDPHSVATVHDVQFQGRTAPNRLSKGAIRTYIYLIDAKTAGQSRKVREILEQRGLSEADVETAGDRKILEGQGGAQDAVELNQLRSSQVLNNAPAVSEGVLPIR